MYCIVHYVFVSCYREQMDPSEVQRFKSRAEVLESRCERLENDLADAR